MCVRADRRLCRPSVETVIWSQQGVCCSDLKEVREQAEIITWVLPPYSIYVVQGMIKACQSMCCNADKMQVTSVLKNDTGLTKSVMQCWEQASQMHSMLWKWYMTSKLCVVRTGKEYLSYITILKRGKLRNISSNNVRVLQPRNTTQENLSTASQQLLEHQDAHVSLWNSLTRENNKAQFFTHHEGQSLPSTSLNLEHHKAQALLWTSLDLRNHKAQMFTLDLTHPWTPQNSSLTLDLIHPWTPQG